MTRQVAKPPVQQPKPDRFKIIPLKPKSVTNTEKSAPRTENLKPRAEVTRPEVKPPEVKEPEVDEPEMETDSEETVVTIEVNLDSLDENEAEDSDYQEEYHPKILFIACFSAEGNKDLFTSSDIGVDPTSSKKIIKSSVPQKIELRKCAIIQPQKDPQIAQLNSEVIIFCSLG